MVNQPVDDEDVIPAVPAWKQRPVQLIVLGVIAVSAFALTRGPPVSKEDAETKPSASYIGDVVPFTPTRGPEPAPYVPPKPEAVAAAYTPTMPFSGFHMPSLAAPSPVQAQPEPAALPPLPTPKVVPGAKPNHPAMMSFTTRIVDPPARTAAQPVDPMAGQTRVTFKGEDIGGSKASAAMDMTFMLMPGLLPCVLDTAINSNVPNGDLYCHLPGPVYSPRGILLMEADTQIIGKYTGMQNGQQRLEATSAYAATPNGIFVPLAGSMTDNVGRNGLPGNVDNRYVERFGAAGLLTLSESALSYLQAEVSKGGNTYLNFNGGGGGGGSGISSLIQEILRSQQNLKPIFTKYQGETIAISINHPIDFSGSYSIRRN
nr:TrbI/VirB10 family protein [uncultured Rhodopila sp.]